eukprot:m.35423 g.35423  ORF g.35423 m.35423 type:complete len:95 (-) comp7448_c0_seq1:214-498(-)
MGRNDCLIRWSSTAASLVATVSCATHAQAEATARRSLRMVSASSSAAAIVSSDCPGQVLSSFTQPDVSVGVDKQRCRRLGLVQERFLEHQSVSV